jgi:hypothetical protein
VLTVLSDRATALAFVEHECTVTISDEERVRVVDRTIAQHLAGQRLGVLVPVDLEDLVRPDVAASTLEGEGPTAASTPDRSTSSSSLTAASTAAM